MNLLAQLLNGRALVSIVISLIVAGVIFFLLNWLIDYCKVPEPFRTVARVILAVVAVVIVINALLTLVGFPIVAW